MVPAVALRHPDDFLAVLEVVAILLARVGEVAVGGAVVEEGLRLFRDDRARLAGGRVRFDDAEDLVAALVVFEGDGAAVLAPLEARQVVRVREERVVDGELVSRRDVEDDRLRQRQRVAGLRVDVDRVFRLQLVGGGGLDVVHFAAVARTDAVRGDLLRVRRPRDRAELVGVAFGAVGAERDFVLLRRGVAHGDVVVPDQRFLRAVRRGAHRRRAVGRRAAAAAGPRAAPPPRPPRPPPPAALPPASPCGTSTPRCRSATSRSRPRTGSRVRCRRSRRR